MSGGRPRSRISRTNTRRKNYAEHTRYAEHTLAKFCGPRTAGKRRWKDDCTDVTACLRLTTDWLKDLTEESARLSGKVARLKRADSRSKISSESAGESAGESASENLDSAAAGAAADALPVRVHVALRGRGRRGTRRASSRLVASPPRRALPSRRRVASRRRPTVTVPSRARDTRASMARIASTSRARGRTTSGRGLDASSPEGVKPYGTRTPRPSPRRFANLRGTKRRRAKRRVGGGEPLLHLHHLLGRDVQRIREIF